MKKDKLVKISITAVFCALAFVMTVVLRFNVLFLSFDFKDAILSIIALMYGPIYGIISSGLVTVLEFLSISDTGLYGLLMNFISSATFVLIAGTIYKYKHSYAGAIAAVGFSVIGVTVVMMFANILITPYYMGVTTKEVISYIPTLLLPFNLCKALINAAAAVVIYKPIRGILKRAGVVANATNNNPTSKIKFILTFIFATIIIIVTVIILITLLNASVEFGK